MSFSKQPSGPDQEGDMQNTRSQLSVQLSVLLATVCAVFLLIGGAADADEVPAPAVEYVVEHGDTLGEIAAGHVSETRVIDSRPAENGSSVRRRRECEQCETRFTTYERLEPQLMVLKRSGSLEPFSPAKLASGISAALADRPVSGSDIQAVVSGIEESVQSAGPQVSSEDIGRMVLDHLRGLDEVAYLRYASVYKEFQGAADFEKEMAELEAADGSI
jgi:transcriptional repressor NrdR